MRYKTIICFVLIFILLHVSGGFAQQTTKQDTVLELMHRIEILTEEIEKAKLGDGIRSGRQESGIEERFRALEHQVATLELEQTSPTALSGYMDFHSTNRVPEMQYWTSTVSSCSSRTSSVKLFASTPNSRSSTRLLKVARVR